MKTEEAPPPMRFGAFVLCHARPWLLPLIAEQVFKLGGVVDFTLDRPTEEVIESASRTCMAWSGPRLLEAPFPALDHRERFMELRQWQLERLRERCTPEFAVLWDDDHVLADLAAAREFLESGHDMAYASKTFFWGSTGYVNARLPVHRSPFFFRSYPHDAYPVGTTRMIHAPVRVHDSAQTRVHPVDLELLDFGYFLEEDRKRVFADYARAGKIDPATLAIVDDPLLVGYSDYGRDPNAMAVLGRAAHFIAGGWRE